MAASFFFYDLETTGFNPRSARIVQFAGQRTDMDLNPVGEPVNMFIKLSPDVLPEPDAVLLTGITPQQTLQEGLTEAEFLKFFYEEVVQPDTIFTGFNTVRFDDEFMRFLHYRNFYDPYEWHWKDGCSRWDILDLIRMTRALRPEGITWPVTEDGKPTNRLELLTQSNGLDHAKAHDAMSDVSATIAVAKLVRDNQPDLFKYLLEHRKKQDVKDILASGKPFMYSSGRYSGDYLCTTAAVLLASHSVQDAALVYDLRINPAPFLEMSVDELIEAWRFTRDPDVVRLPVKTLKYNRCPAVAPLGVMKDEASQKRLKLPLKQVMTNLELLKKHQAEFVEKLHLAIKKMDATREVTQDAGLGPDERLYETFIANDDKQLMQALRRADPDEVGMYETKFKDKRLQGIVPLYKARNYPGSLTTEERAVWDGYVAGKLLSGGKESRLAEYFNKLQELAASTTLTDSQRYLLEELQLYGESIVPADVGEE